MVIVGGVADGSQSGGVVRWRCDNRAQGVRDRRSAIGAAGESLAGSEFLWCSCCPALPGLTGVSVALGIAVLWSVFGVVSASVCL